MDLVLLKIETNVLVQKGKALSRSEAMMHHVTKLRVPEVHLEQGYAMWHMTLPDQHEVDESPQPLSS